MKLATTRRTGRQTTWVEKIGPAPLQFVRKLKALKAKGEFVSYSAAKRILQEEFGVDPPPSSAVIRVYIEGGYDNYLPNDRK
jgi:hypothetical protein